MGTLFENGAPSVKLEKLPTHASKAQCSLSRGAGLETGSAASIGYGSCQRTDRASAGGSRTQKLRTSPAGK